MTANARGELGHTRGDLVRVGLFVLVAASLLIGGLLWLAGARFLRPVSTYTVLFTESVSGLNSGANVEYQGVVVGRVRDIRLTTDIPPKVAVIVDLDPKTAVRHDTIGALLGSLVTGIKFIQLQGGSEGAGALEPGGLIPGDVSSLEHFRDQLAEVADRAVNIIRKLDQEVFTNTNSLKLSHFVNDLSAIADTLSRTMDTFRTQETGKDVAQLIRELNETTKNLNAVISDFYGRRDRIFGGAESTLKHLDQMVTETRDLVRSAQSQIAGTGTSVGGLVEELTNTTSLLQEAIDVIRSDPSVLLRGRSIPERERQP
jgi:phospholipid/cholesterol/gamma-HCH transport system substrate-binding protein